MADILTSISTRATPQNQRARADQVENTAGGYVFQLGDEGRLHRFLTLGTDGATYYTSAAELTRQNADVVFRMAASKPDELIAEILAVSEAGRAPKNKQLIFALAIAASADEVTTRQKALAVMHRVCRTGTHVFEFNTYVEQFRGRGRALNRAVRQWYTEKPVDRLAYQAVKYRSRGNWSHRDLLRLTKPAGVTDPARDALFGWIARGVTPDGGVDGGLEILDDFLELQSLPNDQVGMAATIIERGHGVSWEMIPDHFLSAPRVWQALIAQGIPATALMRQLPRLTNLGLCSGSTGVLIAGQLQDRDRLKRGRVHPINVLIAQRTYAQGRGERGKLTWTPDRRITDALDGAFYNAYGAVEPSGKRLCLALDVSGSMGTSTISGLPITPREAAAALAMVTASVEGDYEIVGFTGGYYRTALSKLDISPRRRLDDVCRYTAELPFGRTDCALPMLWATQDRVPFDAFIVITDNETWHGQVHPHQALESYRQKMGIAARQIVVGMTATNFSIADPTDPLTLDVAGFDSTVPQLIGDFSAGRL